jgi:hypothetical protein
MRHRELIPSDHLFVKTYEDGIKELMTLAEKLRLVPETSDPLVSRWVQKAVVTVDGILDDLFGDDDEAERARSRARLETVRECLLQATVLAGDRTPMRERLAKLVVALRNLMALGAFV